jgi:hypothetical protein
MTARGLAGGMQPLGSSNGLTGGAAFAQGQWRVVMRRPLVPSDSVNAIQFPTGEPVPIAFFAWDGDNGESGTRGSLSTWFFVYLTEPASGAAFATPLVATLLTAGLGIFAVGRAQRRDRLRNGGRD